MNNILYLLILIYPLGIFAEVVIPDCAKIFIDGKDLVKKIEINISKGEDIDDLFRDLQKSIEKNDQCKTYEKLKINDDQIAKYRKQIYGYDRSFNLKEENCSEFKIDTSNMPDNNNQKSLEWCFAYSAVDLISFAEKKKFSIYDLALLYHNQNQVQSKTKQLVDYTKEGGNASVMLKNIFASPKGLCLENEVNFTGGDWEKLSETFLKLTSPDKKLEQIICENQFNEKEIFSNLSADIIKALDKLSAEKRAAALLDIKCQNRQKLSKKYKINESANYNGSTNKTIIEKIDEVLAAGIPLNISYAGELLLSGVNFVGEPDHASTVIGRKFNKASGQCEYLIKNSWGAVVDCQSTSSIKCENGNYWVPRTALKNNIRRATWLTDN
ncbi:MAG: hypothetical protein Q7U04_11045 [Bacteriovorax sp.]|nr:hypothetical protein [Bacteriovorax sp.]